MSTSRRAGWRKSSEAPGLVGWREWVALPEWGVSHIKAKIDTGARTCALHAFDLSTFERDGRRWAHFAIHPWQGSDRDAVLVEAPILEERRVRSSSGAADKRPVVHTSLTLAGRTLPVEISLTRRDELGFRMLIGRRALQRSFLVDPARSFLGGRPRGSTRRPEQEPA